jgi:hypothetical protein
MHQVESACIYQAQWKSSFSFHLSDILSPNVLTFRAMGLMERLVMLTYYLIRQRIVGHEPRKSANYLKAVELNLTLT